MEAYNAKKERMFLESQSRTDFVYTAFLLILIYVMYRYIQLYLLMFLFDHYFRVSNIIKIEF